MLFFFFPIIPNRPTNLGWSLFDEAFLCLLEDRIFVRNVCAMKTIPKKPISHTNHHSSWLGIRYQEYYLETVGDYISNNLLGLKEKKWLLKKVIQFSELCCITSFQNKFWIFECHCKNLCNIIYHKLSMTVILDKQL